SLDIIKSVLGNKSGPAKDIVCLYAGAAIYVSGVANSLADGIEKAKAVIADGSALQKMLALVQFSKNC
ncbi:MAG TPA: anthranilate phosphoribosyltransferase, partial [Gammaproteobacteria bacterium]|nr:anthranilate phosphoribosyltransferase [Gammaproteobacteria bacterium]